MRYYSQLGTGSFFSFKNALLNIFELYFSDLSQRIVIIVFPGPSSFPSLIAPAIFIPQLVPKLNHRFVLDHKE